MSATHFPRYHLTVGLIYGCDMGQMSELKKRACRAGTLAHHPMFLPGIFAEAERVRLRKVVDGILDQFSLLTSRAGTDDLLDLKSEVKLVSFLRISYESQDLINIMKSTRAQVMKMITETDRGTRAATGRKLKGAGLQLTDPPAHHAPELKSTADRIRVRLREILNEYDEKINECKMVVTNMSLTMQTVGPYPTHFQHICRRMARFLNWSLKSLTISGDPKMWNHFAREESRVNTQISRMNTNLARVNSQMTEDMKRDSSQMRSIALLTMVFLPMTAVAVRASGPFNCRELPAATLLTDKNPGSMPLQSIFSTSVFTWDADNEKTVFSGYVWVFVVIAALLTITTVSTWYFWTHDLPWKTKNSNKGRGRHVKTAEEMSAGFSGV
jgi:hypothetical protein